MDDEEKIPNFGIISQKLREPLPQPVNGLPIEENLAPVIFENVDSIIEDANLRLEEFRDNQKKLRGIISNPTDLIAKSMDEREISKGCHFIDGTMSYSSSYLFNHVLLGAVSYSVDKPPEYRATQFLVTGSELTDRLIPNLMTLLELKLAYDVYRNNSEDYIFIDGSFISLLTTLNRIYTLKRDNPNDELWDVSSISELYDFFTSDGIFEMINSHRVFAIPKRTLRSRLQEQLFNETVGFSDMALFSLLLSTREFTYHKTMTNILQNGSNIGKYHLARGTHDYSRNPDEDENIIGKVYGILEQFVNQGINYVYFRHYDWSPANRLEVPTGFANEGNDEELVRNVLSALENYIKYPEYRQPYPMHIADLLAKQLYSTAAIQKGIVDSALSEKYLARIRNIGVLFQNYRS